ncbi:hypothetical protein TorRG33x02_198800 [Trema orientale]|uniref:Uncharacterized protein n=1 Tax=Trema orientale TaxID=63057 RepID=A0A2P5EFJ0_TREOI|nr:hypothetical protein TorRG33x02_198800 [Trema orientale]
MNFAVVSTEFYNKEGSGRGAGECQAELALGLPWRIRFRMCVFNVDGNKIDVKTTELSGGSSECDNISL